MVDEKIYTPEVISDTPFPDQNQESLDSSQSGASTGVYSPMTIKDQPLPRPVVAHELLNNRLNTKTGNILGQFNFQPSGALQIGLYKDGETGDIRISPNGIVARDRYGINTFTLDGETGDALFRGTIMAGDVVVSDDLGIVSLSNFSNTESKSSALNQRITTTFDTWTTITGSDITFTLQRPLTAIIQFSSSFYLTRNDSNDFSGDIFIDAFLDDVEIGSQANRIYVNAAYGNGGGSDIRVFGPADAMTTLSQVHIVEIPAGTHTLNLRSTKSSSTANSEINIYSFSLKYLTLGS